MSGWLCLVFFLSGASALLFETLWFRQASLALGNSVWASSLVLAGFMGGLALGNTLAARFGHRITQPIRLYGLLEILIGATGFCLVILLPALTPWTAPLLGPFLDEPWILNPLRLAIASGLLLFPTTAMGATLPLLVAALYASDARFGRVLGRLYGWNTIGAVVGAVCGDLILIAAFGIRGAAGWAVGLNLIAATIAFVLASRIKTPKNPSPVIARFSSLRWESVWILASAFVLGSLLLALEVVWFRFLLLFVAGSSLAFSLMLAVVLAGIGLGGLMGGRWLARSPGAWRTAPTLAALAGALCIALYLGFDQVLNFSQQTSAMTASEIILRAIPLMFPVSLISGVLFTLLGSLLYEQTGGETWAAGLLTLANTTGGVVGSILGGFVLLPSLGMEASLHWLAGAYAIAAAFAFAGGARAKSGGQTSLLAACAARAGASVCLFSSRLLGKKLPGAFCFAICATRGSGRHERGPHGNHYLPTPRCLWRTSLPSAFHQQPLHGKHEPRLTSLHETLRLSPGGPAPGSEESFADQFRRWRNSTRIGRYGCHRTGRHRRHLSRRPDNESNSRSRYPRGRRRLGAAFASR